MTVGDLVIYKHMPGHIYRVVACRKDASVHSVRLVSSPYPHENDSVFIYDVYDHNLLTPPEVIDLAPIERVIYGIKDT